MLEELRKAVEQREESLEKAKYLKRERKGNKWVYTYAKPGGTKGKKEQSYDEMKEELEKIKKKYAHAEAQGNKKEMDIYKKEYDFIDDKMDKMIEEKNNSKKTSTKTSTKTQQLVDSIYEKVMEGEDEHSSEVYDMVEEIVKEGIESGLKSKKDILERVRNEMENY